MNNSYKTVIHETYNS